MVSVSDQDKLTIMSQERGQETITKNIELILPPNKAELHTDINQKIKKWQEGSELGNPIFNVRFDTTEDIRVFRKEDEPSAKGLS